MGLFDNLKDNLKPELQRAFIARPPEHTNDIIYMWNDRNIRMLSQLTVHQDEVCLFVKGGTVAGVLQPKGGSYTLDSHNIPFLSTFLEGFTGGNMFMAELWFVLTREVVGQKFGGPVGLLKDPTQPMVTVTPLVHGEFSLKVTDPTQLVVGMVGMQHTTNEQFTGWFKQQVLKVIREEMASMVVKKHMSLFDLTSGAFTSDIEAAVIQKVQALTQPYGVSVPHLGNFEIGLNDQDQERLNKFTDLAANAALGRDPGLQGYAQAQMVRGAGQGMAKGGEAGGAALQGMGLGMGMGMANMFNQNMQQRPPPGAPQPQAAGGGAAMAGMVTCGKCGSQVGAGKFCNSCGAPLAAAGPKHCTNCGNEVAPGARFCAGCGSPQQ
jgi:membrane protease subunit (stomatin/prohibitin family)